MRMRIAHPMYVTAAQELVKMIVASSCVADSQRMKPNDPVPELNRLATLCDAYVRFFEPDDRVIVRNPDANVPNPHREGGD